MLTPSIVNRKTEKAKNHSDYDRCKGFVRPEKKVNMLENIAEQLCMNCLAMFIKTYETGRKCFKSK